MTEFIFDIDTAYHDVGSSTMALVEAQDPSTNIPKDVAKLKR